MYSNHEGEIIVGAEGVEHDALLTKLAEARDELFGYERMVETLMINGPEYVVDEMVSEIKRLRHALEFYAKPGNYEPWRESDEDRTDAFNFVDLDGGQTAREALRIGEESNAL